MAHQAKILDMNMELADYDSFLSVVEVPRRSGGSKGTFETRRRRSCLRAMAV
jgi:hypothetical protein